MSAGLFPAPQPPRRRRRTAHPVPPGLPLLIIQTRRDLIIDGDRSPDLLAAAGVTRYQRALDGSTRWLAPRRELLRILRAAERQRRDVTVRDAR